MKNIKHDIATRLFVVMNVAVMAGIILLCWLFYYREEAVANFYIKGNLLITVIFCCLYLSFAHVYDAFQFSMSSIADKIYSQSLSILISDSFMYLIVVLLSKRFPNILPALVALVVQEGFAVLWSYTVHKWYFAVFPPQTSVIVYDSHLMLEDIVSERGLEINLRVKKLIDVRECLGDPQLLDEYEVVFLSGIHSRERNVILKYCIKEGKRTYVIPRIGDLLMSGAKRVHMFHYPLLRVDGYSPSAPFIIIKRLFDIIISLIALIILSPAMLVTAAAIKFTDKGPVFYKQCRLTQGGKEFFVLKFRSMRVDAEKDGVARLSTGENDDRITPVGRIIRKIRMDELPQFFNVLKGDMSIVGPRPERPEIAEQYQEILPEFALRLQAKAGLTGYAQVYGKYNTTPYDKLQMDLMYIAQPGIIQDLMIMFATIKILFMPESTEGVEEGQLTAGSTEYDFK